MKANIGISEKNSSAVALILNKLLADEVVLYTKTRNYHWNIECASFIEMHKFYESQYNELQLMIDEVAERVRKIGHFAEGRLKDFLKLTNLDEEEYTADQFTQIRNLLNDHETLARTVRKQIGEVEEKYKDVGTVDFLTGILKQHESMAWMLRAYLRK
ncbi:DNA starvation/stationary phase protection protein [Compostibacter hankyongensis]|uniref:Dps family protein n=1 Tax=Compostibacter hankyongensis TaxID=1007089 RepID=A0ABP8FLG1_9BACT